MLPLLLLVTLCYNVNANCNEARALQRSGSDSNMPGYYEYQCLATDESQYQSKQCWASTGRCWCVDKWGKTIPGSEVNPGADPIDCETFGWCSSTLKTLLTVDGKQQRPPIGMYIPSCDEKGKYSKRQCHGSTGQCWCAVESGAEVPGTRTLPGADSMDCDNLPACLAQEESVAHRQRDGLYPMGLNRPECGPTGLFMEMQCHGSTGYCWCVDANTGVETEGTRKGPGGDLPDCTGGKKPMLQQALSPEATACQRLHHSQLNEINGGEYPLLGYFTVSCESDGSFSPQQCHPSTGHCWCVAEDGLEIAGTITPPGEPRLPCEARPKTCKERAVVENNRAGNMMMVGMYIPQCKDDGSYHDKQCWGSTGQCWCVTTEGTEVPYTKRGPGATGELNCSDNLTPELVKSVMASSRLGDDPVEGGSDEVAAASSDKKQTPEEWQSERTTLIAVLSIFGCLLVLAVVGMGIFFIKKRNETPSSARYSAVKEAAEAI